MSAAVVGIGARGPLGRTAIQIAMAARAGLSALHETTLCDLRGRPAGLCTTAGIDDGVTGSARFDQLGAPALRAAYAGHAGGPLPLVLALPEEDRPGGDPRSTMGVCSALVALAGVPVDTARSVVIRRGHAGGEAALEAALALLGQGAEGVILGGIDSHTHQDVVTWLDRSHRLHTEDAENGLIPGEGAAFLRLAADGTPAAKRPIARVIAARRARQGDADTPGAALCGLIGDLTAEWTAIDRGWWICDVNGERHRVHEHTIVALRAGLADRAFVTRLPEAIGDVGAASGAMFAAIACAMWRAGCAPAGRAVVSLSSEGEDRGALAIVEATP